MGPGGPTVQDVARRAGVAVGTVSNVLNRPEIVAERTRKRVEGAIHELGFVRNESARQLRAGRSRTLGLVVLDVANPFFTDVAKGVEGLADEAGLSVLLCDSNESEVREAAYLDLLREQRVQGVLITPVGDGGQRLQAMRSAGVPVVLVDQRARLRGLCSVSVDDVMGGRLALTHLLEVGHHRVAFAGGPSSMSQVEDRLKGARQAVGEAGDTRVRLEVIETEGLSIQAGQLVGAAIVAREISDRPTAVFCANDLLALGLLQELTRSHVRVPEDVAIVGYDDIVFAGAAAVPISSVRQPRRLLGRTAAELLIEEAQGKADHQHRQIEFSPELVVRESSRAITAS